ncbi:MAG: hypothetical protein ACJ746_02145 [Bryobacteraceae bacterium]
MTADEISTTDNPLKTELRNGGYSGDYSATPAVVDVIFALTNRNTDFNEKSFVRVDVTESLPYYDLKPKRR